MVTEHNKPVCDTSCGPPAESVRKQSFDVGSRLPYQINLMQPLKERHRVALLTNIPAPYRLKLFEFVNRQHDLEVFFDERTEPNRDWEIAREYQFPHRFIRGLRLPYWRKRPDEFPGERRYRQLPLALLPALRRFRPDVVVSAEMGARSVQASLYCRSAGLPLILWWEGTEHTEGWVGSGTRCFRSALVRHATRFWANGQESANLLKAYGATSDRIDLGMIGIDALRLSDQIDSRLLMRDSLRTRLGIEGTGLLFVGRFVKPKGILPLLRSLEALRESTTAEFTVLLAGGGPEQSFLETWRQNHPSIRTRIFSFQGSDALADLYAASDIFIMPTLDDNWSLVALEAAVAGLPQVLSRFNGAALDLISRGVSGVDINPLDIARLTEVLGRFVEAPPPRTSKDQRMALAGYFSAEAVATRACQSIEQACLQRK